MTTVNYFRNGKSHRLSVVGHAGYAEHGKDIVCSAVSALGFSLLGFLMKCGEAKDLSHLVEDGRMIFSCEGGDRVDAAFEMAVTGYQQLSENYPQYVELYIATQGG